jgi:hypothetical protein
MSWYQAPIWNLCWISLVLSLLFLDSYGSVDVRCPLRREVRSVGFSCCWASPAQSFSGLSPAGLMWLYFIVSILRLLPPSGPVSCIYIPHEQGCPVIPSGTVFGHWVSINPCYIALAQSMQKTLLRTAPLLLHVFVATETWLPYNCLETTATSSSAVMPFRCHVTIWSPFCI